MLRSNLAQFIDPEAFRLELAQPIKRAPMPALGTVTHGEGRGESARGRRHPSDLSGGIRAALAGGGEYTIDDVCAELPDDFERKQVMDRLGQLVEWGDVTSTGSQKARRYQITEKGRAKLQAQQTEPA